MTTWAFRILAPAALLLGAAPVSFAQKPEEKKPPIIIIPPPPPPGPASYTPGRGAKPRPAATAATPGAPAAPSPAALLADAKPAPQMDQLKFLVGKWKCDGKQLTNPMFGPEHPITGSAEVKVEGESFWQSFSYEEKKTKVHPGLKVHGLWGWDDTAKRFVRAAGDNRGTWDTATTLGLVEGKIVWGGDFSGPLGRLPFRHTFTKKNDREWTQVIEIQGRDGKWGELEEVTCKK